ncbi:MAG: ATP-binding cassette domain-containing protein [Microbacterium sp.]
MTEAAIEQRGIRTRGLTWTPWGAAPTLTGVDLKIDAGERVLIAGASGSGKTTLLRALAGVLTEYAPGDLTGEMEIDRRPGSVALLLQNPAEQVVAGTVGRDVAFGPENIGVTGPGLHALVDRMLARVRLGALPLERRSTHLSGGQGQRLGLAGLLGLSPSALLLDEPLSMLDQTAADTVRAAILDAAERVGAALIVADHDIAGWWPHVDRIVVLDRGHVVHDGEPTAALRHLSSDELWLPHASTPQPRAVEWASEPLTHPRGTPLLTADAAGYSGDDGPRLRPTRALAQAGTGIAITGPSGAGKTTLLRLLAGWLRPTTGTVTASRELAGRASREPRRWSSRDAAARIAFAGQDPTRGFVSLNVLDEVLVTRRLIGRYRQGDQARARSLLESLGLPDSAERSPHSLSGGEQRRLAVAVAIVSESPVVLLDEPTVGQDRVSWSIVAGATRHLADTGRAVVVATHDRRLLPDLHDEVAVAAEAA